MTTITSSSTHQEPDRRTERERGGKGQQTSKQFGYPIAPLLTLPSLERNCMPCAVRYKLHPATAAAAQLKEDHLLGGLIPRRGKLRHKSKEGRGQKYANNKEGKWSSRCESTEPVPLPEAHTPQRRTSKVSQRRSLSASSSSRHPLLSLLLVPLRVVLAAAVACTLRGSVCVSCVGS